MEDFNPKSPPNSVGYLVYKFIFLLSYPILFVFSVFFVSMIGIFSWISKQVAGRKEWGIGNKEKGVEKNNK